jgi:hypothetical protein
VPEPIEHIIVHWAVAEQHQQVLYSLNSDGAKTLQDQFHPETKSAILPRQIRAVYDDKIVRVYQAYSDSIADIALANGTFVSPPFKMERMTWIKPSFLWMMYRSGWGLKEVGQSRILAIDISREGFEWALAHSCPSSPDALMSNEAWARLKDISPVRIQWDPERNLRLEPLPYRSIQIGLSTIAVDLYVRRWIQKITDVTEISHNIYNLVVRNKLDQAQAMLPPEKVYTALIV